MEDIEEEELLNLSLTIVTDSNGADMNMKRKRSREDHVFNPLMNIVTRVVAKGRYIGYSK